jgi:hypothetical protein
VRTGSEFAPPRRAKPIRRERDPSGEMNSQCASRGEDQLGEVDVKVLCERGGYNRYFLRKKPRTGHVCTAPSEVNDRNGRRG